MSVPQPNSAKTSDRPTSELERRRFQPAHALHRAFERLSDQCFDFLRTRSPWCFVRMVHRGLGHVWQHLDRQIDAPFDSRRSERITAAIKIKGR